jgi:branched-chain amino acid transport system substrate-binding protein
MRAILPALFASLLVPFFATQSLRAETPSQVPEKYVIGAILPLSGDIASFGEAARNGIELALSSLPPAERAQIEVVFEDDAFVPKRTVAAYQKLKSVDKVKAIIAWGSTTSKAIAQLAEEHETVMISISSDPKVSNDRSFVFSHWVTPDAETLALLPELKRRGYSAVARFTAIHDGTNAVKESFDRLVVNRKSDGALVSLVSDFEVGEEIRDFRPMLTSLRNKSFQAFLPIMFPTQLAIFARQARELGFTQEFFGYESFEDPGVLTNSSNALLGAWFATTGDPAGWFSQAFRERYPKSTIVSAGNAHDAVVLLTRAVSAGGTNPAAVAKYLRTVHGFPGALGTYGATPGNKFGLPAVLKRVALDGFPLL